MIRGRVPFLKNWFFGISRGRGKPLWLPRTGQAQGQPVHLVSPPEFLKDIKNFYNCWMPCLNSELEGFLVCSPLALSSSSKLPYLAILQKGEINQILLTTGRRVDTVYLGDRRSVHRFQLDVVAPHHRLIIHKLFPTRWAISRGTTHLNPGINPTIPHVNDITTWCYRVTGDIKDISGNPQPATTGIVGKVA